MSPTQIELGNFNKPTPEAENREESKSVNLRQFLKEVREEFAKITWPSREQTVTEFFSVVFLVVVLTGIIFLFDKAFEVLAGFFSGRLFL